MTTSRKINQKKMDAAAADKTADGKKAKFKTSLKKLQARVDNVSHTLES